MRKQMSSSKNLSSHNVAKILGTNKPILVGLPDQHLDTIPLVDVITPIENIVKKFEPNITYCQYGGDLNKDHQIVFEAALVALRPKNKCLESIYAFYTVGSTEWNYPTTFEPDTWICFDKTILEQKINAFKCYYSEICEYPNPRSEKALINLAKYCGNQVCAEYAETFSTIRSVKR